MSYRLVLVCVCACTCVNTPFMKKHFKSKFMLVSLSSAWCYVIRTTGRKYRPSAATQFSSVWCLATVYISLKVHLGIILVNNQIDALFSMYLFTSLLCMFRANQCSSSGESNFVNTSFRTGIPGSHLHRLIYTKWCIDKIWFSWWWALVCSKHAEKGSK